MQNRQCSNWLKYAKGFWSSSAIHSPPELAVSRKKQIFPSPRRLTATDVSRPKLSSNGYSSPRAIRPRSPVAISRFPLPLLPSHRQLTAQYSPLRPRITLPTGKSFSYTSHRLITATPPGAIYAPSAPYITPAVQSSLQWHH